MEKQVICPKCSHYMDKGIVVDFTHGGSMQSQWAEGEPERSIWTGLKLKGKEKHMITTYRCSRCGYLESYAPADR
jgi:predicted nucleic-acid-binding Zn-ribbon protein